ncbi:endoribonuclease L-PSP [Halogranum amylolyticum]|uniref:Endoribonuclease L-PSP n=1 Tax=Halogranum amylolyticum TaxID=660520 RepID=A0A1H8UIV5_9EURY|nr:Rid family detoxifying hydrolase [Halogranum amylolyticum]SEP03091.1 endoribonuclease L-PSP [Halogranum amylolyticum]
MEAIATDDAPPSIGPFSQAIRDGNRIYVSGQGPIDPETGEIISGDVAAETAQTLENMDAVLHAAGRSLDDTVKATIFVRDLTNYDAINEVYAEYMSEPYPARSAVEVSDLPVDIEVEIELVASAVDQS